MGESLWHNVWDIHILSGIIWWNRSIDIVYAWLLISGWWLTYPSEKYASSSVGITWHSQLFMESHSKFHSSSHHQAAIISTNTWNNSMPIGSMESMVLVYMLTLEVYWWDPWSTIYSSTMDPSWDRLNTSVFLAPESFAPGSAPRHVAGFPGSCRPASRKSRSRKRGGVRPNWIPRDSLLILHTYIYNHIYIYTHTYIYLGKLSYFTNLN